MSTLPDIDRWELQQLIDLRDHLQKLGSAELTELWNRLEAVIGIRNQVQLEGRTDLEPQLRQAETLFKEELIRVHEQVSGFTRMVSGLERSEAAAEAAERIEGQPEIHIDRNKTQSALADADKMIEGMGDLLARARAARQARKEREK